MNNVRLLFSLLLASSVAFSCQQKKKSENSDVKDKNTEVIANSNHPNKYFKTFDAGSYTVTFESNNAEVSILKISTKGLEREENDLVEIEGRVLETYMTDLNQDGFKEFFITVSPNDDSENINMIGIASNDGKSFSDIAINEPTELRDVKTDMLSIDTRSIVREFKVNGKSVKYNYSLVAGEAGYSLTAIKN